MNARTKAKLTQTDLAKRIGVKNSVIIDIENGSGEYVAGQINAIERVLGVKINRNRKK